jgi:nicotinate-nucleotide adenylyltransferase
VAFFGGSFDPPHLGHLAIARAARQALQLDRVLFAPVGAQPLKPQGSSASFEERLEMTRLAIGAEPGFAVSRADAPQQDGRPNYSWETLRLLREELTADSQLFFLMGADSLRGLRRWYRAEELPFLATLVVASRPGEDLPDLSELLPEGIIPGAESAGSAASGLRLLRHELSNREGATASLYLLPDLEYEISATAIREAVGAGNWAGLERLLPIPVIGYLQMQKLYQ